MAEWKHILDISGFYFATDTPPRRKGQLLAGAIREKILPWYEADDELKNIVDLFENHIREGIALEFCEGDFNVIMSKFYDWCDQDHRVWIKTREHM